MSAARFGDRYFATRERLAQLDRALQELAASMEFELPVPEDLAAAHRCLDSPFVFLVAGEVNAGKSSLLNALAGAEICQPSPLPNTRLVTIHHHLEKPESLPLPPLCENQSHPHDFLRHFTLIDTPGLDARAEGLPTALLSQIPRADLIFCVFSVANPWAAATWNWLHTLPPDSLDRTVIVVQRCDEREPKDLPVILGHLADLSLKRLGRTLPMFTVSARLALEPPKTTTSRTPRMGGFGPLEDYIAGNVCLSPVRWQALRTLRDHAAAQLTALDERIDLQHRNLILHHRFVDGIEREMDQIRQTFVDRLPVHLSSIADAFRLQAVATTEELDSRLGTLKSFRSLISKKSLSRHIEGAFSDRVRDSVGLVARKDAAEVTAACLEHWQHLKSRIQQELGIKPSLKLSLGDLLESSSDQFVKRLESAVGESIDQLRLRRPLEQELLDRNLSLKAFFATSLTALTAAGCCGALGFRIANITLLVVAILFWSTAAWIALSSRHNLSRDFQNRLLDACEHIAVTLHQDYLDALQTVFRNYASTLDQVRDHLTRERQAVGPKQQRWQQLFLVLKTIEQDF